MQNMVIRYMYIMVSDSSPPLFNLKYRGEILRVRTALVRNKTNKYITKKVKKTKAAMG
jgi:hypothetical protein